MMGREGLAARILSQPRGSGRQRPSGCSLKIIGEGLEK